MAHSLRDALKQSCTFYFSSQFSIIFFLISCMKSVFPHSCHIEVLHDVVINFYDELDNLIDNYKLFFKMQRKAISLLGPGNYFLT